MKRLAKNPDRDFIILNLTDVHMDDARMHEGDPFLEILHRTVDTLLSRITPDLITITGDLAWSGNTAGQKHLLSMLEAYGIPWAPVFGNHDHDLGEEKLTEFEAMLSQCPHCLYERGESALGHGNYTILVEDAHGHALEGLIFMDTHCKASYVNSKGENAVGWAKLWENQLDWYTAEVRRFADMGCRETAIFQHIPPYGYREAWNEAFRQDLDPKKIPAPHGTEDCWNPGYESSYGVQYEGIGSHPVQDGVLDTIVKAGSTRYIFCGHEHINNWKICYRGVYLIYTLKTGCGAYWRPSLNGGTVIRVSAEGISSVEHEYVTIPPALCEASQT